MSVQEILTENNFNIMANKITLKDDVNVTNLPGVYWNAGNQIATGTIQYTIQDNICYMWSDGIPTAVTINGQFLTIDFTTNLGGYIVLPPPATVSEAVVFTVTMFTQQVERLGVVFLDSKITGVEGQGRIQFKIPTDVTVTGNGPGQYVYTPVAGSNYFSTSLIIHPWSITYPVKNILT